MLVPGTLCRVVYSKVVTDHSEPDVLRYRHLKKDTLVTVVGTHVHIVLRLSYLKLLVHENDGTTWYTRLLVDDTCIEQV